MSVHGRKPLISGDDWRLWEEVRRSVKPLHPEPRIVPPVASPVAGPLPPPEAPAPPGKGDAVPGRAPQPAYRPPVYRAPVSGPRDDRVTRLDEGTARRLRKGALEIDARIDLHGQTEMAAHHALQRFLEGAQRLDHRIVLVITGKGSLGGGVLRAAVPRWFLEQPFSALVSGFRPAHRAHGGEGALYVRLRRIRSKRGGP